jgi:hypothetical protein
MHKSDIAKNITFDEGKPGFAYIKYGTVLAFKCSVMAPSELTPQASTWLK